MIPLQLELKNFMSYRAPVAVDFQGIRTACLSGENGAGKSALLEAMTWAVWGKSRATSSRDIVTLGESQMEVTFDFRLADRDYRVFRRQTVGTRTSTTLEFFVRAAGQPDDDWHTITADSVRETDRKIVSMLKMDYETFVNSAFLMQGQADTFTQKRPGDRKKVLADILNLGDYDVLSSMAREEDRALRGRANNLSGQVERIDQQLKTRPDVEAELNALSAGLIEASASVEHLEEDMRLLQGALSALAALIRSRNAAAERLERQQGRLKDLSGQAERDERALGDLQKLIERGDAIEQSYKELQAHRKVQETQAAILRERQPSEAKLNETERALQQARSQVERGIDRLQSQVRQTESTLKTLSGKDAELQKLAGEIAAAGDLTAQVESLRAEIRKHEAERTTLHTECNALRTAMNEIKANLALLKSGDAECPICRRPMGDGEHDHVEALWTGEGTELGNRFRSHSARIKELDAAIPELTNSLKRAETAQAKLREKQVLVHRLQVELNDRTTHEAGLEKAHAELKELSAQLASNSYAGDLPSTAAALNDELAQLVYDAGSAHRAAAEIKRLQPAEREYSELQTARVRHANLLEAAQERSNAVADLEADITTLRIELEETSKQLADEPAMRQRLAERADSLDRARAKRDTIQSRFGAVSNQISELDRLADEYQRLQADLAIVGVDADAYRELALAFGRNGIQAMIVETILPELEDEANRLLARMTTSHLHVRFRSTRQAVSNDNIIETLDIIIRDETGERPYALYSGGEAFRVDFAIRVALSKLLVRRAGTTIDMLIIDEGFGTQDARGRDGLVEALQTVEADFATILVITHIDDVRDMFPTRIEVTKTESGSSVTIV